MVVHVSLGPDYPVEDSPGADLRAGRRQGDHLSLIVPLYRCRCELDCKRGDESRRGSPAGDGEGAGW